ncbi:MAG: 23S rRNA (guanosine(2251)-2'-O)-methyltransferase RlmB [Desulfuromonadales bacterium GWD2_61_12]|nr:MAG: 23S rRNA (guanosine(2251)-2'-O)-methyltransferase RlmB [Desulfuromonadales bacterium GWC2_61_20]OGR34187.1 MAG: 23S rRNA (guanosine(2251)-2'-O)-methyltransferase RlmB [Desulfuromonadales bacterium GWD2_61_12]HAD05490.1 23S rRNA (guanosine(2251)-2'-O)-methyltransferase RlmB [Desulfuromonas sp.]
MAEYIYGINPAFEGLRGTLRQPLELLVAKGLTAPRLDELVRLATAAGVPVRPRDRAELDRLADSSHHQGVLLKVADFAYHDLDDLLARWRASKRPALFLILDGVTDPHNFGALLRSADAAGCHGVIVAKDRACPVSAVVEKTAAGALAHIPLAQVTNISRTLEELKEQNIWVYGLAGDAGSTSLYASDLTGSIALVAGSEGEGMRPNVRKHCDGLLAIPLHGGVDSLNVSVATGIALFEVVRQRGI